MKVKNCYGCGGCVAVCPTGAIVLAWEDVDMSTEKCVRCGRCQTMCPIGLIEVERGDVCE